ncbi:carnitine O-acetyltransferase-like isoform X2 [Biomphalaria glabrata]|uniref:Carnitine O-acetyltransferase n=1 Tax=Biomphalaria glabrata TaxID=6526 RepID=A0A9W3B9E3_BIOGL|nr:carnitine O-acetyltransferase-like isoform X2 [Biomphalaria glabrata]
MIRYLKRSVVQATGALSRMVVKEQSHYIIPRGRTFSVQYSLPKLPVPQLEQTLKKYLETCRPLLTDDQYKATEQIVHEFQITEGPVLQKLLEERAAKHLNWLSDWWKHVAYLDCRDPIVVNVNPGLVLPRQSYRGQKEQLAFAAKFICGVLDYKVMLDEQTVPVETLGGKPLCMVQYYQLLTACRIPGIKSDTHVFVSPYDPDKPRHINVIHKNHIFSVDVYHLDGAPLSEDEIHQQLQACIDQSQTPAPPIGILTSLNRTVWGKEYARLTKDKTNLASLENIQRSIFAVCLDGPNPPSDINPTDWAACIMLHGGGCKVHSGNRWFDKTLQFILNAEGYIGLNYEHTTAEGPAIIGVSDHVMSYIQRRHDSYSPSTSSLKPPVKLDFNIDDETEELINKACAELDVAVENLMFQSLFFKHYGKTFIKSQRLSPDAFIQVAFQLAYYRLYKEPCATYETGSLRKFQLGRTDTIRSCSSASLQFSKAMEDPSVPDSKKVDLLRQAVVSHRKYTDETVAGQGIDRHLLGLKLIALENGMNVPQLFLDPSYKESSHWKLSTSQVASNYKAFLCFGPVVLDGYGICYNPQDEQFIFAISSYKSDSSTSSELFSDSLTKSLLDMQFLLASHPLSKL